MKKYTFIFFLVNYLFFKYNNLLLLFINLNRLFNYMSYGPYDHYIPYDMVYKIYTNI